MSYRHLLLAKYAALNASAAGLVGAAYANGYLDEIIRTDSTHMCALIAGLAVAGVALAGRKAWWLAGELDVRPGSGAVVSPDREKYRLRLQARLSWLRYLASLQVILGLVGTVVGFIEALGGVDPSTAGDASSIAPMVASLVSGMHTALYTTLVGSVGNILLMLNLMLLKNAAASAWSRNVR